MFITTKNRNINFLLVAVLGVMLIVTFAIIASATAPTSRTANNQQSLAENKGDSAIKPLSADAFPQYRQSEWTYVPLRASLEDALAAYHRSEWSSVAIPVTDMSGLEVYHRSERTLVDPNAGLAIYQLSERTLIDPQAGLATYFESERTSIPVNFTTYQLSEWFGQ